MKISQRIESIFSIGVALEQSGKLKNTIYVLNREIFIMNVDFSVLLKFPLRQSESTFFQPLSFKASDYDSNQFYEEDGKIIFVTEKDGFEKKKICGFSEKPEKIEMLYKKYGKLFEHQQIIQGGISFNLSSGIIQHLDTDLSHIEFSSRQEQLKIIQRNIYSGTIIEISKIQGGGFGVMEEKIPLGFGPVGMRTNDFLALFSFLNTLEFAFINNEGFCWIKSKDPKFKMDGFLSLCQYDEMGSITTVNNPGENHGRRKEQEERDSVRKVDPEVTKSTKPRRTKKCR